ncbi:15459_t:CDS:2, partial [Racocetra persica]
VVSKSTSNTSLESYIHQKNANDTILYEPYYKIQIVEIIGDGKVIVDVILENGDKDQLANIIRYDDEQLKKKSKADKLIKSSKFTMLSKDSHSNAVVFTMLYEEKKNELYLLCKSNIQYIENAHPLHRDSYIIDFVIYVKI